MNKNLSLLLATAATVLLGLPCAKAQDTVDALHYDLRLDLGRTQPQMMYGDVTVRLRLLAPLDSLALDLEHVTLDSLFVNGAPAAYVYDDRHLRFPLPQGAAAGSEITARACYHTAGRVESAGFGGLHLDPTIYYNLGVGFSVDPCPYGRSLFPCRDNFTDKATYALAVSTAPGWTALCSGQRDSVALHPDGAATSYWTLREPIPTYLLSVSAAPFRLLEGSVQGEHGTYPFRAGFRSGDTSDAADAFALLPAVVRRYEGCFGPYRWHTIGYAATPRGSMEHANNIHLAEPCATTTGMACQSVTAHELAHAWFGNLVTAASADDMWFNEGGASFCEELALGAAFGDEAGREHYRTSLFEPALLRAHRDDGAYIPLHAPSHDNIYGTTIYKKGACAWHSLRGYLGDSLFYASLRRLFLQQAFGNISTAALQDSLSAYSGMDLADFFRFHVYGAGWQDFDVQMGHDGTQLRQTLRGADVPGNGCKVPVTFFSADLRTSEATYDMDGALLADTTRRVGEGSPWAFAVVDLAKRFSYASWADTVRLTATGDYDMPHLYFMAKAQRVAQDSVSFLAVTHHYTAPHTERPDGTPNPYLRFAQRYWTVAGLLPQDTRCNAFFTYSQQDLDHGLYQPAQPSFDSLRLLYRARADAPWQVVGRRHTGTATQGAFVATSLKTGEYAIAVVDTAVLNHLSLATPAGAPAPRLVPNPSCDRFRLEADGPCSLRVSDMEGRVVYERRAVQPGEEVRHGLPTGTYVGILTGDSGSCAQTLVVQ